jgi:hypothetical protein
VKAISAANAQAAYSTSRASARAAHDAAMLDAMEDWQLSSRDSLTDLLFTEGQSRETYNVATSNVYANWENGVGNLLGDKPQGTGYVPVRGFGEGGGIGTVGSTSTANATRLEEGDDEPKDSELKSDEMPPLDRSCLLRKVQSFGLRSNKCWNLSDSMAQKWSTDSEAPIVFEIPTLAFFPAICYPPFQ